MIPRYTRPEMGRIWTDENKFKKWLHIEILACEAFAEMGEIPPQALKEIKEKARFDVERVAEIEKVTKHDVVAFLTAVAENVGEASRYIHFGLTSSDILDTSLALLLKEASELIIEDIRNLLSVLKDKASAYKDTVMIGRSHGVHAEPITFGLKMALWYDEMRRNLVRMERAKEAISYGKISGAVGTFGHISPFVEDYVCRKCGLKPSPISTQIIQRDRHAEFFTTLAIIASSIEKFATEIRHLQRTEVLEAEEFFTKGQKGSSAMPHKRNPILSENLCGLARLVRANSLTALEGIPLWHERDISHSSVERVIAPDSTILLDYMLNRAINIIDNLLVYPDNMMRNVEKTKGLIFSEGLMLELAKKKISRGEAYAMVQRDAMRVWEGETDFKEEVLKDPEITKVLSRKEIEECFDLKERLRHVDEIFKRVFEDNTETENG
ncbi:MAG: adenylosuccinate lyase [Thermodesulfobacteriota bacterium]